MTLPSASQWKPVTAIRADYEFTIAFCVPPPPPPPVPPPPRRLERRCGGRHFFHDRRVDRNGARTRSTSNRKPSRQAENEECVAHECLPGSLRRQRTAFPFSSTCLAEVRLIRWVSHGEHIQLHPILSQGRGGDHPWRRATPPLVSMTSCVRTGPGPSECPAQFYAAGPKRPVPKLTMTRTTPSPPTGARSRR
jgi:hypothetical protein